MPGTVLRPLAAWATALLAAGMVDAATNTATLNPARALGTALADAIERAAPAVVQVVVARHVKRAVVDAASGELKDQEGFVMGTGSGFFFDDAGHILTANHVVEGRHVKLQIQTADGYTTEGEVVGTDPNTDLAVLKIRLPADRRIRPLEAADSDAVRVGELAIALGAPLGLKNTATLGIISQKGRDVGQLTFESFLQTDASINPGTSGGPVVDVDGRWIGVSVMIETTGEGAGNVGIGFVVPSSMALRVAKILAAHGQMIRSYIGIAPEQLIPSQTPLPPGMADAVRIAKVSAGSPAEAAGLKVGDIIVRIDGHPTPTLTEIKKFMHVRQPGDTVRFDVFRDGRELTIEVTAGAPPK